MAITARMSLSYTNGIALLRIDDPQGLWKAKKCTEEQYDMCASPRRKG